MSDVQAQNTLDGVVTIVDSVENTIEEAAKHPIIQWIGRIGYAAKGFIYVMIGWLALLAAFGQRGGETTDRMGIMQNIAESRFGLIGLMLLGFGFLGYGTWQVIRGVADVDNKGRTTIAIAKRLTYVSSGITYIFGSATVGSFILQQRRSVETESATKTLATRMLEESWGNVAVVGIGIGLIAFAIYQFHEAWSKGFQAHLDFTKMPEERTNLYVQFGRIGYLARGIVVTIIATFFFKAALTDRSTEIKGFDGALTEISRQTNGQWLLAMIAVGVIAYGLYALFESRYRSFYPARLI
ncbi:MAG: DUF1206 domain-containing protein [Herpetosiphon sp.]|nr:DUF1206 domain-containing protein [Herpetosiphon sp.]